MKTSLDTSSVNIEEIRKSKIKRNVIVKGKKSYAIWILLVLIVIAFIFSFTVGAYSLSVSEIINVFYAKITGAATTYGTNVENVIFKVRMPRIFAAILIGCALSAAGSAYQGLFRNPMVAPDILGASGGAGLGAAIGLLLSFSSIEVQAISFVFGLAAVFLTIGINSAINRGGEGSVLSLILTGMVIASLCQAFISIIKYVGDPKDKLPQITFWLMGGLSTVTERDVLIMIIPMLIGIIPLFILRWRLNVLSFGDEEAGSLGINTYKMKIIIIVCSTLITAASVSIGGIIGWVGLIIPHLARMIVGPNYKVSLPASMLIGSIYLLLVDDIARGVFTTEIPLGILTSLIGAPFFIYLLLKGRKGWI
ncbi:iron ABC transporter permease [Clostridium tyrobutyricum]|jgi:iron complex transport system permease protein|uniref:FecCD family ABC transporter permease n=1 Tax=Clostridium tyrobutyricum TaxID=1519 RepID=UPI00073D5AB1|nr:iron ABC transporter permease [Clostridium tyrobutyricum]MBR9649047.1 iron ABC transporter permease [Clostridium tyrobutyricum]MBV4429592.1 iron ABC transporter permease [Clostridium tyrobutyricum]MBV4444834.1 iron ABC transporter permease [Clostridium tyrobutyricum]MBV4447618.1 iron ABC transporter permease [Clostridium tyrobutyricum]MBV4449412.1 iron ABC transporter permease [Clostridium tyrobutyricum]